MRLFLSIASLLFGLGFDDRCVLCVGLATVYKGDSKTRKEAGDFNVAYAPSSGTYGDDAGAEEGGYAAPAEEEAAGGYAEEGYADQGYAEEGYAEEGL